MAYDNLKPGRYPGTLTDWSMSMNERLNQPEVHLKFEFDTGGRSEVMTYRQLINKKDGTPNLKLQRTLKTVGFEGDLQSLNLPGTKINNQKLYSLTVEKNEGGYWNIEWVNDPLDAPEPVDKTKLNDTLAKFDFSAFNKSMKSPAPASNGAEKKPFSMDDI